MFSLSLSLSLSIVPQHTHTSTHTHTKTPTTHTPSLRTLSLSLSLSHCAKFAYILLRLYPQQLLLVELLPQVVHLLRWKGVSQSTVMNEIERKVATEIHSHIPATYGDILSLSLSLSPSPSPSRTKSKTVSKMMGESASLGGLRLLRVAGGELVLQRPHSRL